MGIALRRDVDFAVFAFAVECQRDVAGEGEDGSNGFAALLQLINAESNAVGIVVVRAGAVCADGDDGVGARQKGHAQEEIGPATGRYIVVHHIIAAKDRSDKQRIAQQVLPIQRVARRIVRKFQHHGAHCRHACAMGLDRCCVEVGHQAAFQPREVTQHIHGLLIEQPGHAVGGTAVQATMRGEQAEGDPAFVDIERRGALEAADVVAPKAEAGKAER